MSDPNEDSEADEMERAHGDGREAGRESATRRWCEYMETALKAITRCAEGSGLEGVREAVEAARSLLDAERKILGDAPDWAAHEAAWDRLQVLAGELEPWTDDDQGLIE